MKRVFICLALIFLSLSLSAQNYKKIKGIVRDVAGMGLDKVSVAAFGTKLVFYTDSNGAFEAYIPETVEYFELSKAGYLPKSVKAEGYVVVALAKDPEVAKALEAKKAAASALIARKAEEERLAEQAERERISQEIKTEVNEAMANRKDTVIIRQTTEKVIIEKQVPAETVGSRNRFSYKLDFGYTGQISGDDVVFEQSGIQTYGNLSPISLEFTFYVNVGKYSSFGVGVGASYSCASVLKAGDNISSRLYGSGFTEKRFDVPVYADARFLFGKSRVRPAISVSGGIYSLSVVPLGRASAGCQFLHFKKVVPFFDLSLGTSPFPYFSESDMNAGYRAAFGVSVKAGIVL